MLQFIKHVPQGEPDKGRQVRRDREARVIGGYLIEKRHRGYPHLIANSFRFYIASRLLRLVRLDTLRITELFIIFFHAVLKTISVFVALGNQKLSRDIQTFFA